MGMCFFATNLVKTPEVLVNRTFSSLVQRASRPSIGFDPE
jgi:hypothetical protein